MAKQNVIVYSCNGSCDGDIHHKTADPNEFVYLVADATEVTLTFTQGSPFKGSPNPVVVEEDTFRKLQLKNTRGRFPYRLTCENCSGGADDPILILEL